MFVRFEKRTNRMNKLKNILRISLMLIILIAASCKSKKEVTTDNRDYLKEGFTSGTVINYTLDGCSWMIKLDENNMFEPKNLQEEYRKENLKIWFKYTKPKNPVSICMAGDMIEITEIHIRK